MTGQRPLKNIDTSQPKEVNTGQKGESRKPVDILKLTVQEASAKTTHENVAGEIGKSGGVKGVLSDLVKRHHVVPEARIGEPSDRRSETHDVASGSEDNRLNRPFKNYTALHGYASKMRIENLEKRLQENPRPESVEMIMGTHREELRPQFIDAIPLMTSKGYETWSSGSRIASDDFNWSADPGGEPQEVPKGMQERVLEDFPDVHLEGEDKNNYRRQQVDGGFTLDEATIGKLKVEGFNVDTTLRGDKTYTRIFFDAREPNLKTMKEDCDKIAAILPDRGRPAPLNMSESAIEFRNRYGQDTYVASRTVVGAIDIPGRQARDTYAASSEASLRTSSEDPSDSSPSMEL